MCVAEGLTSEAFCARDRPPAHRVETWFFDRKEPALAHRVILAAFQTGIVLTQPRRRHRHEVASADDSGSGCFGCMNSSGRHRLKILRRTTHRRARSLISAYGDPMSVAQRGWLICCWVTLAGLGGCTRVASPPPFKSASSTPVLSFLDPQGPVAAAQRAHLIDVVLLLLIVVVPVLVLTPIVVWRYRLNGSARYTRHGRFSFLAS